MTLTPPDISDAHDWVTHYLAGLHADVVDWRPSARFRGGQTAADAALANCDVRGYAARRNEVFPEDARGATALSPYIRHGLISLRTAWDHVAEAPAADRSKFRDELLWQEYARHLYNRLGRRVSSSLRYAPTGDGSHNGWADLAGLACGDAVLEELSRDGWIPNQTRMWLASHWTVRNGSRWTDGERRMYAELLDGSYANRVGWQWTVGSATGRPYGFSRWQVERRAPGLCARCEHRTQCPIEEWPDADSVTPLEVPLELRKGSVAASHAMTGSGHEPETVWMTAESLGDDDPALAAHPELPVWFMFDSPLLRQLQLHPRRLVFMVECLADLAQRRDVTIVIGDPSTIQPPARAAVTAAPVPGFDSRARTFTPAEIHPWPWLAEPHAGSMTSFSAWRSGLPIALRGEDRRRTGARRRR